MLKKNDTEDVVSMIWCTILSWLFPAEQGYSVGPEFRLPDTKAGTVRRADLIVQEFAWRERDDRRLRAKFAIVESKRPGRDSKTEMESSKKQLEEYLRRANRRSAAEFKSITRWGAIAVGRFVQFYSHGGGEKEDAALWTDTHGKWSFELEKDSAQIQEMLLNIKEDQHRIMTQRRRAQQSKPTAESLSSSFSGSGYDTDEYQPRQVRGRSPGAATQPTSAVGGAVSYGLRSHGPIDPNVNYYRMAPQPQFEQLPYRPRNFSSSPLAYSMHNYDDEYEQRRRRR